MIVKSVNRLTSNFPGRISISDQNTTLKEPSSYKEGLALWSDGSRLNDGRVGAGIAWQNAAGYRWERVKRPFDAELYGACKALELAQEMGGLGPVTVLLDSGTYQKTVAYRARTGIRPCNPGTQGGTGAGDSWARANSTVGPRIPWGDRQ